METPRETLISNFSDGKSPTGSQFKMLIESIVSRQDDGMDKGVDSALKICAGKEAHAPALSLCPKDVLDPQWVISLKAMGKEGLNIGQGDNPIYPALYIDKASSNVGFGTNEPNAAVEVYRSVNGEGGLLLHNPNEGAVAYVIARLKTLDGQGVIFKNSSARIADGGAGTMTMRNDAGDLRLQSAEGKGSVVIKTGTGNVGINNPNPEATLDVNGNVTLNGNSLYLAGPATSVGDLASPGIFWYGANFGADSLKYAIYKTAGGWAANNYQQLRLNFETGIQLGAGTGPNTGYAKSYVEVVNGKGLMVSSGNLGVGTVNPIGKGHIVTTNSHGDIAAWGTGQFVVGQEAASGNNSGGLGISYSTTNNASYLSSVSPGVLWRDLGLRALNTIFYASGSQEAMRLTPDGKLGIGINTPALQLHVRRDVNEGMGMFLTNLSGGSGAYAIQYFQTDAGVGVIFKNSSTRTHDGGANTMTVRNDNGDLRLLGQGQGIHIKAITGYVGVGYGDAKAPISIATEGKALGPDGAMHITRNSILFGGPNNSNMETSSAGISVGIHHANSLCFVGMSDANKANRRIDIWAEGGMFLRGGGLSIGNNLPALAPLSIYNDGKEDTPDGGMHISRDTILFGGSNNGRDMNSAQISAGKHVANSLNILGMSSGPGWQDRRIDLWVEGGMYQYGPSMIYSGINNSTARPAVTKNRNYGEIAGYSSGGAQYDDGFLRLSAGGGTNANTKSFIDLSGYSTIPEMNCNLVMGTAGAERMRISGDGKVGIGTPNPLARLHVASNGRAVDGQGLILGRMNEPIRNSSIPGELLGSIEIGFAGYRDNEPNQIGAKIAAMRLANYPAPNSHFVQATELAFFTGHGTTGSAVTETLRETCLERMRINKDGNVGLGTANPQHKLQLQAGNLAFYLSDNAGLQNANGYANIGSILFYGHGRTIANDSAKIVCGSTTWDDQGYLAFHTSNDGGASPERLRITQDGKVGVGTVNPAGKMHVITPSSDGNVGNWDGGQFVVGREASGGGDSGAIGFAYNHANATSYISSLSPNLAWRDLAIRCNHTYFLVSGGTETLRIHNNACVGIGNNAPLAPLSIGFGHGKEEGPDSSMHITNDCILFGGNNNGKEWNSCQISAGKHQPNSLNLVGMSSGAGAGDRRVDMWAEGGFNVNGYVRIRGRNWYPWISEYHYMNPNSVGHYGGAYDYVNLWADERIVCREFNTVSDVRTKINIEQSNAQADLEKLLQIQVSEYNYKDSRRIGETRRRGVIAQQVFEIFPEAVNTHSEFVPDIFDKPKKLTAKENVLTVAMNGLHGMKDGDKVRLMSKYGQDELEVKVKNPTTFIVEGWNHGEEEIFVYGKKVDDFMVVDYQRIFTLGLSATQELSHQVDTLKAENAVLKEQIAAIMKFVGMPGK